MTYNNEYHEQHNSDVLYLKNISGDHGREFLMQIQYFPPSFKEEINYYNNCGYTVNAMTSTGIKVEHKSIDIEEVAKGFLIVFRYKVELPSMDSFRSFIFNIDTNNCGIVLSELARDFKEFDQRQRKRALQYRETYNYDFVLCVNKEILNQYDNVFIPECNMTISKLSASDMSDNPVYAFRGKASPTRQYMKDKYKEEFKIARTIQSVAPDHVPDNYFYFLGKKPCKTEAVMMSNVEEGIRILTHEFDAQNNKYKQTVEFIPAEKAVENGYFRTKADLLNEGDVEAVAKRKLAAERLELENLRIAAEQAKAELEKEKLKIRTVELSTEKIKANTENVKANIEYSRQRYEDSKLNERMKLLIAESALNKEKMMHDIIRLGITLQSERESIQMKKEQVEFLNEMERVKVIRKFDYEIASNELALANAREKAVHESKTNNRKSMDEGFKLLQSITGIVKYFL